MDTRQEPTTLALVLLAYAVAALHAAAVVLLLTGAVLALRWRRVVPVHASVAAVIVAVHVAGADCPLTTWERALRERAGATYDGGFLDHYLFGPLGLVDHPWLQLGTYAVVLVPNLVGYALLLTQSGGPSSSSAPTSAVRPAQPDANATHG